MLALEMGQRCQGQVSRQKDGEETYRQDEENLLPQRKSDAPQVEEVRELVWGR